MDGRKNNNFNSNDSVSCSNPITAIRENVYRYLNDKELTIREFSEIVDISQSTLNNLLYGSCSDCKLSTAISLAKALGVSIDELTSAGTIDPIPLQNLITCRSLPQNSIYLIRWFIKHQETLYKQDNLANKKIISVMQPLHTNDGIAKVSNNFLQIDISELSNDLKSKVFFGIKINHSMYMPYYSPYDVLLIANDRNPLPREHVVVVIQDNIFLAKRRYENGHFNYYGVRDNKFRCDETGITEYVGYITGVMPDTTEIGTR